MGRGEAGLSAAQMLYPLMQCTDVFFLRADVCQLGVDQRKVRRPAYLVATFSFRMSFWCSGQHARARLLRRR